MAAALDAVAEQVKARPDLFDRVFHASICGTSATAALLYLPPGQLDAIRARLDRMEPLLGPIAPAGVADARRCSRLLAQRGERTDRPGGRPRALAGRPRPARAAPGGGVESAADTLRDPTAYRNPWASVRRTRRTSDGKGSTDPQYFFTPDGSLGDADLPAAGGRAVVHAREGGERRDARDPRRGRNRASPASSSA